MTDYRKIAEDALAARANVVEQMRNADQQNRSEADMASFVAQAEADIARYTEEARSAIEQGEREAEARSLSERAGNLVAASVRHSGGEQSQRDAEADLEEALRAVVRGERPSLDVTADGEFHARAARQDTEYRAAGANTAITTNPAWAGTTIQTTFLGQIIDQFRENSPVLQSGVRVITTSTGERMEWPRRNAILSAAQVAEGATYGKSKSGFDRFGLDVYKYGVIAEATYEMVNDTQVPLVQFIGSDIGERLGDVTALDLLRGDGIGKPEGLVTSTVLNTTVANAAGLDTDALIRHQHSLKPKYRARARWHVSDDFVLKVRLLKDLEGRYVWQPGLLAGAQDTLLGKPVTVDVNMDLVGGGANRIPALFGDFSFYIVRMVGGVSLSRSEEYGWDSDIWAWKGSVRVGGGQSDLTAVSKIVVSA